MKSSFVRLALASMVAAAAPAAFAVTITPTPISFTGGVNTFQQAADGFTPANFTPWQTTSAWWDGPGSITFQFAPMKLTSAVVTVDWNDVYQFDVSSDNVNYVTLFIVGFWSQNVVNNGQVTLPVNFAPTANAYSFLRVKNVGGDNLSAVGEVSLTGTPAVPEPATMALMLAGVGVVGLRMRQRRSR
jgi:hypothetical protein